MKAQKVGSNVKLRSVICMYVCMYVYIYIYIYHKLQVIEKCPPNNIGILNEPMSKIVFASFQLSCRNYVGEDRREGWTK
jgi:hypothetical protein